MTTFTTKPGIEKTVPTSGYIIEKPSCVKEIESMEYDVMGCIISLSAKRIAEEYKDTPLAKMHSSQEEFAESLQRTIDKQSV